MKTSVYKEAKLNIFEKSAQGLITEAQRDELLYMLEEKKESTELTPDAIEDMFAELEDKYPDLKDDIKKLGEKIKKADDKGDDDSKDDEDKEEEKEVSESVREILSQINAI